MPCPECYSLIEILSLNEENQILEFQCTKNNHNKSKILTIFDEDIEDSKIILNQNEKTIIKLNKKIKLFT